MSKRPKAEGGVWGAYIGYLEDLERRVERAEVLCDEAERQQPGRLPAVDVRDLRAALSDPEVPDEGQDERLVLREAVIAAIRTVYPGPSDNSVGQCADAVLPLLTAERERADALQVVVNRLRQLHREDCEFCSDEEAKRRAVEAERDEARERADRLAQVEPGLTWQEYVMRIGGNVAALVEHLRVVEMERDAAIEQRDQAWREAADG